MANRKLGTDTTVTNRETGQSETFPAGTAEKDLPDWANIDNESAWMAPVGPETPDDVEEQYTGDYADMSNQELLEELRSRGKAEGLSSAKKSELIAALEEDDAGNNG
jgi:hypothetical protein